MNNYFNKKNNKKNLISTSNKNLFKPLLFLFYNNINHINLLFLFINI